MTRAGEKWRPSLGLVIFTMLASVATLPLIGLFFFRLYDNQLIHQTQAELIAQSRVLATLYAKEVEPHSIWPATIYSDGGPMHCRRTHRRIRPMSQSAHG